MAWLEGEIMGDNGWGGGGGGGRGWVGGRGGEKRGRRMLEESRNRGGH